MAARDKRRNDIGHGQARTDDEHFAVGRNFGQAINVPGIFQKAALPGERRLYAMRQRRQAVADGDDDVSRAQRRRLAAEQSDFCAAFDLVR